MLIDKTYFKGDLLIPNLNEPNPDENTTAVNLDELINQVEEDVLSFSFGVKMWLDFKAKYEEDSTNLPQNYKDLLHGKTYTSEVNGREETLVWKGLIQETKKESLLAYIVYVVYNLHNVTQTTAFGQTMIDTKVGTAVSISPKMARIYNDFIYQLYGEVRSDRSGLTLEGNPYWNLGRGIDYRGFKPTSGYVSLVRYLLDNVEDYPLFDANYLKFGGEITNEFGL
jgi:hypothetical protein